MDIKNISDKIIEESSKIIVAKRDKLKLIIAALFSEGHVLLNDLPGSGKTTLVKTLSIVLGLDFKRIQFVSDMLPSDIIGMNIYNQKEQSYEIRKGPVMTNILLSDEINRAIPRTQSALLEAMEEHQVTIDGKTMALPSPFFVLATENPIEKESTFPLPSAELDRFLISLSLGYLSEEDEVNMLRLVADKIPFDRLKSVTNKEEIEKIIEECKNVYLSDSIAYYIVKIVSETREDKRLKVSASARASRSLYRMAKAWAAINGRDYVIPEDVKEIAHAVLDHRLVTESSIRFAGISESDITEEILKKVEAGPDLSAYKK